MISTPPDLSLAAREPLKPGPTNRGLADHGRIDRNELRRAMRMQRKQLSIDARRTAMRVFAQVANRELLLRLGRRIGVYHAYGHEADMGAIIHLARRRGCELYLPRVTDHRRNRMVFAHFPADATLRPNAFGILEPQAAAVIPVRVRDLDVIFLPLVAFDASGWRLGSGAGFYDRKLHHLTNDRTWRRPRLIGIAYDFQRVPRLIPHRWDIPLDAVITERGMQRMTRDRRGVSA